MSDIDAEIKSVEAQWNRAMTTGDESALRDLIADDAILTHGSGKMEEKGPFIANLFRRVDIDSIARDDVSIRQVASTAVLVFCHQEIRLRTRGEDGPLRVLHTSVSKLWIKRDSHWRLVNYHATRRAELN